MKGLTLPLLALTFVAGFTVAQQQTQQSQSASQGNATSSASSSAPSAGQQGATVSKAASKWTVAKPTHAIFYSPNPVGAGNTAATISPSLWDDQKKYFELLGKEGKLLYAGPYRDGVGAMLILNCENDQAAQLIADEDPVVKSMLYVAHVRAWNVTYIGPWVVMPDKSQQTQGGATTTRSGGG